MLDDDHRCDNRRSRVTGAPHFVNIFPTSVRQQSGGVRVTNASSPPSMSDRQLCVNAPNAADLKSMPTNNNNNEPPPATPACRDSNGERRPGVVGKSHGGWRMASPMRRRRPTPRLYTLCVCCALSLSLISIFRRAESTETIECAHT